MGKKESEIEFKFVDECISEGRDKEAVISDLDGTILRGRSSFPYFMLIAFEASGILRFAILLLLSPIAWFLYHFISEAVGIKFLIFVTFSGVKVSEIVAVSRAVLPKFYLEDLHSETWRVFSSFGKRYILTANPRVMIEPLAMDTLGVDQVIGSELQVTKNGRATGFVKNPGVLVGENKAKAMEIFFGSKEKFPEVALGDRKSDHPFMRLCKERYVVPIHRKVEAVPKEKLPKPIVFHDGRFVKLPTPAIALLILVWMPIGFLLAVVRIATGALLPMRMVYHGFWFLGVRVFVKGTPPPPARNGKLGVLFACTHKTLLDPIFLSTALGRPVTAVVYSVSRVSEILSPIRTVRLSRDRETDASNIRKLLEEDDLVICPEGTTCREPFLLRFSALFAELADQIVPVATNNRMSLFHGTTARGWKGMDPFFYFMNPSPVYEVIFLDQLPHELTCGAGKSSFDVANYIQRVLAGTLGFECTNFTRKDKYQMLAGTDGTINLKPSIRK